MSESRLQRETGQTRPFHSVRQEAVMGVLRTADLLRRHYAELFEPWDVTAQQYNVLRILRGARPDPLPTMEIGDRMIERTPGVTRLLDRLEGKGWVARERCAADRRQVLCSITPAGLALLDELDVPVEAADEAALRDMDEERVRRLIALLDEARAGLA